MKYALNEAKLDLGVTPIENVFLNNYLALADGNSIKVYLYAYKKAFEGSDANESFEEIAGNLGMEADEVADAFGFWQEQGIVDIEPVPGTDSFSCNFKSLRELFLGFSQALGPRANQAQAGPGQVLSNDGDRSMTNRQMYDAIEEVLGTSLLPNEIERIHKLQDEFGQDRDLIVEGFNYSSTSQGKKNVNYVLTVLRNWAIDGIYTKADLLASQASKEEKKPKKAKKKVQTKDKKSSDEIQEALNRKLLEDYKKAQGGQTD